MNWLKGKFLLLDTLAIWWRTRKLDDKEFRQHLLGEVIETRNQLFEVFKDEPASRELLEAFTDMDSFIEEAKAKC